MVDETERPEGVDEQLEAEAQGLSMMQGHTTPVDLQVETQKSYLGYAMSVIVGRALPDMRDGLEPVHRRVLYVMWDGGYRPDRGQNKCSRVVGEVMGLYHPHGDSAVYGVLMRLAQPWAMRHPLVVGQGNFGSQGNDKAAAMRYTECEMAPLAVEIVRDIEQDIVDFEPNYDDRGSEPTVLSSRFPSLLVSGSTDVTVGIATNIPTHNLREVNDAVQWALTHPEATKEELLEAAMARIQGLGFLGGGLIVGWHDIEGAYRTGCGSVIMRAVMELEGDSPGRQCIAITQLPYMCNPDNLATKIAESVNSGRLTGISDIRDDTSARTGLHPVIVLKRDAQPRIVMNNLYKHTVLQDTFDCNMPTLIDDVPHILRLDQFIAQWVKHQIEVIRHRTAFQLVDAEKRAHLGRGLVKALNMLDEVIALIQASRTAEEASRGLQELLGIDELQVRFILDQQLRRLASMEIQKIIDRLAEIERLIAGLKDILVSDERQRTIIGAELQEITDKYDDEQRTRTVAVDGDFSEGDFITNENTVVTTTHGGCAKRTRADQYRVQKRDDRGVRGATLRADDEVVHPFKATNHEWLLLFTNLSRVYRAKVWQLPKAGRGAKGGHVAGLLSFLPDEHITQVLTLRSYDDAPYLLLTTRGGFIRKTTFSSYDSPRQAGMIAINFREEGDELIGVLLCPSTDDVLLTSRKGQAIRSQTSDDQLRPMGRTTSGVTRVRFRDGGELLSMAVLGSDDDLDGRSVLTVTDEGFAERITVGEYCQQGRGGLGIKAMRLSDGRGSLAGGLIVGNGDEVISIKQSGQVVHSAVADIPVKGRDTMEVKSVGVRGDDAVAVIALYPEAAAELPDTDAGTTTELGAMNQTVVETAEEAEGGDGDE